MKKESNGSRITTVILVLICIALAATVIYKTLSTGETHVRTAAPTTTTVTNVYTEAVTPADFTKTVRLYGKVVNEESDVSAVTTSAGYVTEILVEKGDKVNAGTVLGYIDSSTAGSRFKAAPVEAKVSGTVAEIPAVKGAYMTAGSQFALISPAPDYYISLAVPERYLFDIGIGSEARLLSSIDSSLSTSATVSYIDEEIESSTNSFSVELQPESQKSLRDGMTVTVDLITKKLEGVYTIPMESITAMSDGTYVYVVDGDQARLRKVELGDNNATSYVVLSGLEEGDVVITEGTVSDGTLINAIDRSTK